MTRKAPVKINAVRTMMLLMSYCWIYGRGRGAVLTAAPCSRIATKNFTKYLDTSYSSGRFRSILNVHTAGDYSGVGMAGEAALLAARMMSWARIKGGSR